MICRKLLPEIIKNTEEYRNKKLRKFLPGVLIYLYRLTGTRAPSMI